MWQSGIAGLFFFQDQRREATQSFRRQARRTAGQSGRDALEQQVPVMTGVPVAGAFIGSGRGPAPGQQISRAGIQVVDDISAHNHHGATVAATYVSRARLLYYRRDRGRENAGPLTHMRQ